MDNPNPTTPVSNTCPVCHQSVLPQYYFCPNCGAKLNIAPLSTTLKTQIWIYFLSIILPMFCFLFIGKWPGNKYLKSSDPKAKEIGWFAWALLIISTIVTYWLIYIWTQHAVQSAQNSLNADFGI